MNITNIVTEETTLDELATILAGSNRGDDDATLREKAKMVADALQVIRQADAEIGRLEEVIASVAASLRLATGVVLSGDTTLNYVQAGGTA